MATKVIHVSDLSGQVAGQQELARLTVVEHPGFTQTPVVLEVLPDELKGLETATSLVTLEYLAPGARRAERMTVTLDVFNRLAAGERPMDTVLLEAAIAGRERRAQQAAAGRPARRTRARVNYATMEHAGEPHRGRITDNEKRIVQEHLDLVNERLERDGHRRIDPANPKVAERYGLTPPNGS
jgi:hypothetical protein